MSRRENDEPVAYKKCQHCGEKIDMYSYNQKYCQIDDDPACNDERITSKMTDRQFANYRGIIYKDFIQIKNNQ